MPDWSADVYQAPDGTKIHLLVPWESNGSGRIPPATIAFNVGGEPWRTWLFAYAGSVDGIVDYSVHAWPDDDE